ncbi:MAG TPA: TonB-dependent receptor [Oleiagrimonas sp.]|nr:TonB-dependent receptor [Oleiagrimonas sp.]
MLALLAPTAGFSQVAADPSTETQDSKTQPIETSSTRGDAAELDAIVVTGVRGSLARSTERKRYAPTVQDSISALELGKFPDDNVADSLSHITGVSISRTAGGEGQKVSVRGLGPEYTLTTFNGRILATDGAGRAFAFDVLPADVISGADVIKGARASLTEGAIGGLINLRSASPFDYNGQQGIVRLEGTRNQMSELNGGKFSATYSNTFANDTFGVLVGVVLANRKDRTDIAGNDGGWARNTDPNDPDWSSTAWGGDVDLNGNGVLDPEDYGLISPGQFRVGSIMENKKRRAYSAKLEWHPTDTVRITVDGLKTRLDSPQVSYQQSFYTLFAPGRWSDITVQDGIVTGFTMANPDPDLRLNPELLNQTTYRVVDTDLYGINGQWQVTPDLTLTGDLYRSTSSRHSGGLDTYAVLRMALPNTAHISLGPGGVPNVDIQFPDGSNLATRLDNNDFTAADFKTHYMELGGDNIDDEITGAKIKGSLFVGNWHVDRLLFGVTRTEREKKRDLINNTLNGGADYYADDYAINLSELGGKVLSHSFHLPHFMDQVGSRFPRSFLAFDVPAYLALLRAYDGHPRPGGGVYDFDKAKPKWNPLQSYRVTEKTTDFYVEMVMSGAKWNGNIGARLVHTDTTAQAWDAEILSITPNGQFNYTAKYADPTSITEEADYTYLLPSANFTWHFNNELQLRAGAAKTMARPSVEMLAPTNTTESIAWGEFTQIYGGNVHLKPYTAIQGGLSLEWYFSTHSIANIAVFYKRIENQITTSWETGQDIGVPGHLFNVQKPINGDHAKVKGLEIGLQHFWDNGFGVRAQYTRNWSTSWVDDEERPLEGIAPATYSLGLMYEKGKWSLGANAVRTDGYVTAVNVLGTGYNEEADPITWMTANVNYQINDMFSVSLQGDNLLDAEETYSINGNPLLLQGYYRYGRSYTLGVSMRF